MSGRRMGFLAWRRSKISVNLLAVWCRQEGVDDDSSSFDLGVGIRIGKKTRLQSPSRRTLASALHHRKQNDMLSEPPTGRRPEEGAISGNDDERTAAVVFFVKPLDFAFVSSSLREASKSRYRDQIRPNLTVFANHILEVVWCRQEGVDDDSSSFDLGLVGH
ncbi:hypothetical protein L484_020418 [Morus notabilis]|uniref:Uncharacterized protein n=1 Tax=Morus notabilis TaxID=981085 RepID=W9SBF7_9ROSA|nr:hypothetical protein L484_020418 [Morus notabilis]